MGEETVIRVRRLKCNFRGGAVSGDDRVQGVALVVGGREGCQRAKTPGSWTLESPCPSSLIRVKP